ncbi:MAG TPA: hypothetical protein VHQ46_03300 [Desulfobacteria bacterium]|nr:hypothetical protein [Desulfobacteria bacterium]
MKYQRKNQEEIRQHSSEHNFAEDYYTEPVFSTLAVYGVPHKTEQYGDNQKQG